MTGLSARIGIAVLVAAFVGGTGLPAAARDFVQDQAGMFSAGTVAQLNERISNFNAQTGKEIVVVTTPSLNGATLQTAASNAFTAQNVNGVLIFIARDDRRDMIVPDRAGANAGWFTSDVLRAIRGSMEDEFKSENFDAGITGAVDALLGIYRSHLNGLQQRGSGGAVVPVQQQPLSGGFHLSMFWFIVLLVVGFLIVRSVLRAATMQRYYGGPPPAGTPPGGYGPGGPGYPGYGYGGYGGGGSFWSGLLGGLGGAWLGNELFRGGGGGIAPTQGGPVDSGGGWGGGSADSGGWQSDAGQASLGSSSGGDWSGGGFGGDSGGGGDFGGGGGGDSGGGW